MAVGKRRPTFCSAIQRRRRRSRRRRREAVGDQNCGFACTPSFIFDGDLPNSFLKLFIPCFLPPRRSLPLVDAETYSALREEGREIVWPEGGATLMLPHGLCTLFCFPLGNKWIVRKDCIAADSLNTADRETHVTHLNTLLWIPDHFLSGRSGQTYTFLYCSIYFVVICFLEAEMFYPDSGTGSARIYTSVLVNGT